MSGRMLAWLRAAVSGLMLAWHRRAVSGLMLAWHRGAVSGQMLVWLRCTCCGLKDAAAIAGAVGQIGRTSLARARGSVASVVPSIADFMTASGWCFIQYVDA
jgi:hypothetical protein